MSEAATIVPPMTMREAAKALNVSEATVKRMPGLRWIEYRGAGRRTIKRIDAESVRRLLEGNGSQGQHPGE